MADEPIVVVPPVVAAPAPVVAAPPEPQTFSRDYVHELREENKAVRLGKSNAETALAAALAETKAAKEASDAAIAAAKTESEATKATLTKAADDRVIRSELRTAALKAGMVDLDGLLLADLSTVKLNDAGEVEGAEAMLTALKAAKPFLFGAPTGTSSVVVPPVIAPVVPASVKDMTRAEYDAAKRALKAPVQKDPVVVA